MWLPRVVEAIKRADEPVALLGGEPFGVPFVLDALRREGPLAWFELDRWGGPVSQGNALARAVNAELSSPLLPLALPYRSHLASLARYRADLRPLRIAVTVEQLDDPFVTELLELHGNGYGVVLDVRGEAARSSPLLRRCRVVDESFLTVTLDEALAIVPGALGQETAEALWRRSRGRFTDLTSAALRAAGLPALHLPSPSGPQLLEQDAELVDVRPAIYAFMREGDPASALELAVLKAPDLVDDLLKQAGPRFQSEGLLERLHLLLSALPEAYAHGERVLEWRLVAAVAANDYQRVFEDVDAYLATHLAPALRARRAGTLPHEEGFVLAEQAVEARRTPLTLWQYGRLHPNDEKAVELLRESVKLAEESGAPYDVARNAHGLASRLLHMGEYARAASWARWALDVVDREQLQDGSRRLQIVNQLAAARIMSGDLVGLRNMLEDAQAMVEGSLPGLAVSFRSTLAMLELAEGCPVEALGLLQATYHASQRRHRARFGYQLVRVLLELERLDDAAMVASDVMEVASAGASHERTLAALARGMVGAVRGEETADDLLEAMLDRELIAEQRLTAALYYLLATGGAAHNVPRELVPLLGGLSRTGLMVLSGPERVFEKVWSTLAAPRAPLVLRFLGEFECRFEGQEVHLPTRLAEAALALALHPEGLSRDELNDFLTPDGQAPYTSGGMRSLLTRLRQLLPVVSEAPYRFTVPYEADVVQVREWIKAGRIREALGLMRGQVLPTSVAPGVEDLRWEVDEQVRQAVLLVGDADALYELAERFSDDLEFWQAAAAALQAGDPRLALARARVRRLEESYGLS